MTSVPSDPSPSAPAGASSPAIPPSKAFASPVARARAAGPLGPAAASPSSVKATTPGVRVAPPPSKAARSGGPGKGRRKPFLAWGAAAAAVLLAAAGVLFWPGASDDGSRAVRVFVTDLPGGYERLELEIGAVLVGEAGHPLRVLEPVVEISRLQGPENGLLVAEGRVPTDADGAVSFVFLSARGFKSDAWEALDVPESRLTVRNVCPTRDAGSCNGVFDFDLSTSLALREDGQVVFQPFIQNLYQYESHEEHNEFNLQEHVSNFVEFQVPEQYREAMNLTEVEDLLRRICATLGCASTPTVGDGGGPPVDPGCGPLGVLCENGETGSTSTSTNPTTTATTPTGGGPGKFVPKPAWGPSPGLDEERPLPVTLAWTGDDDQVPLYYDVYVNGKRECVSVTTPTCKVDTVKVGQLVHSWYVVSKTADGTTTTGTPWTFQSDRDPLPPTSFTPADGTEGVSVANNAVSWEPGFDPDGESLDYQIHFSTNPNPGVRCPWQGATSCSWDSEYLTYGNWHYWKVVARDPKGRTAETLVQSFKTEGGDGGGLPTNPIQ